MLHGKILKSEEKGQTNKLNATLQSVLTFLDVLFSALECVLLLLECKRLKARVEIRLGGTKTTPRHTEREKGWSFIRQRERGECKVEWERPPTSIFGQKPTTIAPQ